MPKSVIEPVLLIRVVAMLMIVAVATLPGQASAAAETRPPTGKSSPNHARSRQQVRFVRPYLGSTVHCDNLFSATSLNKGYELTHNPVYLMRLGLRPVWRVAPSLSLLLRIQFETELTNSDWSTKQHEVLFKDLPLELRFRHGIEVNDAVRFLTGLRGGAVFPTSKMSRFLTLRTAFFGGVRAALQFPKVFRGFILGVRPTVTQYLHDSRVPVGVGHSLDNAGVTHPEQIGSPHYQSLLRGRGVNVNWSIENALNLSLILTKRLTFIFVYSQLYARQYATADNPHLDRENCASLPLGCAEFQESQWDEKGFYAHRFTYDLSYHLPRPMHLVTLYLGALTEAGQLGPSGTFRDPFFNRTTMITFGFHLNVDAMVSAVLEEKYKTDYRSRQEEKLDHLQR